MPSVITENIYYGLGIAVLLAAAAPVFPVWEGPHSEPGALGTSDRAIIAFGHGCRALGLDCHLGDDALPAAIVKCKSSWATGSCRQIRITIMSPINMTLMRRMTTTMTRGRNYWIENLASTTLP